MVVGMSLYSQIREAYISGESQRSIAKRLGISRQTVKKYCEGETMPGVRKDYLRAPSVVTTEVESFISMCLEADKDEGLKKADTHRKTDIRSAGIRNGIQRLLLYCAPRGP